MVKRDAYASRFTILHINDILGHSVQECTDILYNAVQQTLTAFLGGPGDVRGDDAVGRIQQGIVCFHRFFRNDIHRRAGQLA